MKSIYIPQLSTYKLIAICVTAALIFCFMGIPNQLPAVIIGCTILFIAILFFIKFKYDSFVFLNILLLSIVLFEPSPSDILFIVLLVFGIINRALDFKKIKYNTFILLIFLSYFFASIPGMVNATNGWESLRYFIITFYLFFFAVFIFLYLKEGNHILVLRAYAISTLIAAVSGIIGFMGFFPQIMLAYADRAKGLFKDPNVFGPFLIPTIIILLNDLTEKKVLKTNRLVHIGIIIVVTAGVVLSFSRAAWINLCIAVLLYLILNFKRSKMIIASIATLVVLMLPAIMLLSSADPAVTNFFEQRAQIQVYDSDRFAAQEAGLEIVYNSPLGCGPGQFESAVLQLKGTDISAHSLYIRVLSENGVVGFILFFTALISISIGLLFIHIKKGERTSINSSVLLSIMIGLLVNSLVVDTLHWRHLWFFVGLALFNLYEYRVKSDTKIRIGGAKLSE